LLHHSGGGGRYIGPELLQREGTKKPDDWPPQSKKRKVVIEEADVIRERTTIKDTRSVIKLYPIEQDFNDKLHKLTEWFKTIPEGKHFIENRRAQLLPSSLAARANRTISYNPTGVDGVKDQTSANDTTRKGIHKIQKSKNKSISNESVSDIQATNFRRNPRTIFEITPPVRPNIHSIVRGVGGVRSFFLIGILIFL
jgi:hypothetical protein